MTILLLPPPPPPHPPNTLTFSLRHILSTSSGGSHNSLVLTFIFRRPIRNSFSPRLRVEFAESEKFPPSARNFGPGGEGRAFGWGSRRSAPCLPGLYLLAPRRRSPAPILPGGFPWFQLRTSHVGPGLRRHRVRGKALQERWAQDPLTLRSLPCSMHDPPRAPTWALTCKVSGAGNGHPERDSQEPCFGLHALPRGHRLSPRGHWAPHNPKLQYKFSTWLLREILGKN